MVCNFEAPLGLSCWWVVLEDRGFFACVRHSLCPRSGVQWWLHGGLCGFRASRGGGGFRYSLPLLRGLCPLAPPAIAGSEAAKAPSRVQMKGNAGKEIAVCGGNGRRDGVRGDSGWWSRRLCLRDGCRYGLDTHRRLSRVSGVPKAGRCRVARFAGANEGKSRQRGRGLRRQRLARQRERRFKEVEPSAVLASWVPLRFRADPPRRLSRVSGVPKAGRGSARAVALRLFFGPFCQKTKRTPPSRPQAAFSRRPQTAPSSPASAGELATQKTKQTQKTRTAQKPPPRPL